MINADDFLSEFLNIGLKHFTGVPDSTLKEWTALLVSNRSRLENRIAANEGTAIAHATGYYLSTKKLSVVYLQNAGLGNCVSPLTSLTDPDVYSIPLLIVMGWRGKPGLQDEPQHKKMGAITLEILNTLNIPYSVLDIENYKSQIKKAKTEAEINLKPYVLIIEPGFFKSVLPQNTKQGQVGVKRENAIKGIIEMIDKNDLIVSTTGKTSRELFEMSANHSRGHDNNFYNVGSMGHVSSIGLEIAMQKSNRKIFVLDGDGSLIMHMGSLSTIGYYQPTNLTHIIFDNESHESTGKQPTTSKTTDFAAILKACNYKNVDTIQSESELSKTILNSKLGLKGIVVKTQISSRFNLGRPTDTPIINKNRFMDGLIGDE